MRPFRTLLLGALALLALLALDLGTKEWALSALSEPRALPSQRAVCEADSFGRTEEQRFRKQPLVLIPEYFEFRYAENCGAAFGLLRSAPSWLRRSVFGVAAVVACLALLWMFASGKGTPLFAASVPLIVSGAIGNLIDRARHGYVVDFIRAHIHEHDWPTFNVADITITVGVALMLLDGMRSDRKVTSEEKAEASSGPS